MKYNIQFIELPSFHIYLPLWMSSEIFFSPEDIIFFRQIVIGTQNTFFCCSWQYLSTVIYRAFHNIFRDYKHLWQENTKRLRRILHTVVFDIDSSLAAVPVDFFWLCRKLTRTRSTSTSAAIFSLHTLASPRGRNVNYDKKQITGKKIFELFLPSVRVS
jgi:hypothetical protein